MTENIAEPPRTIPSELLPEFTLQNRIRVEDWYIDNSHPPSEPRRYTRVEIDGLIQKAQRRENNYYGDTDAFLFEALKHFPINDLDVAIMGSVVPWYEAICLAEHVRSCTIIEYGTLHVEDSRLSALTVEEFNRNPRSFDAAISISSFEHDGLGRYGDPINPRGDFDAMQRMTTIIKPGGLLFLAVPVGVDRLVWNAHRIYGALRLPLLLQGWEVCAAVGYSEALLRLDHGKDGPNQPVFVLRNVSSPGHYKT